MKLTRGHFHCALLGLGAFAVALYPVSDADIFWHVRTGMDILDSGSLPRLDPYSVSTLGHPWVNGHVLFQLAAAGLYSLGGLLAIAVAKAVVVGLTAALLGLMVSRRGHGSVPVAFALVVIALSRPLLLERPVVLSLLFLIGVLCLLEHTLDTRRWPWLAALPLVCGLWTWCQPLWPLGPALVLAYAAGQALSRDLRGALTLFLALAASCLACLVGPYGLAGLALPFVHLFRIGEVDTSVFSANVSENLPLLRLLRTGDTTLVAAPMTAAISLGILLARPLRIPWSRLGTLVALFGLTLVASRNALLFYWAAALLCGLQLGELAGEGFLKKSRLVLLAPVAVFASVFAWLAPAWPTPAQLGKPRPFLVPSTSLPLLEKLPSGARVFASVRYGSYLVLKTSPRAMPYIDGRLVLRTAQQFTQYLRAIDEPAQFPLLDEKFRFDAVLLPAAGPDRYQPLLANLAQHPDWVLAHTDGLEVLFMRRATGQEPMVLESEKVIEQLASQLEQRFAQQADVRQEALTRLGGLLSLLERETQASSVLGRLDTPKARALLGASHYRAGDLGAAKRTALRLLEKDPKNLNAAVLLATIALDENNFEKAEVLVRQAADLDPHDPRVKVLARRAASSNR
jgi:hypothetical protein